MIPLSPDRPLKDPSTDQLGYAGFCRSMSDLLAAGATQGMVVGLFGAWGSGKTTVLNFIDHYLTEDEGKGPVVLRFNPWWISGSEPLARRFFQELFSAIAPKARKAVKKLQTALDGFASVVAAAPTSFAPAISGAVRLVAGRPTLDKEKVEVERLLAELDHPLVVMIDDIDRLPEDEVRQVFKLVRAIADFPNVTYVLAMDREHVAVCLDPPGMTGVGRLYLEKIVQLAFDLPMPDPSALRRMLTARLDGILSGAMDRFDPVRWGNAFFRFIDPILQTPRHVARLTNSIAAVYPRVAGEVDPVDFVVLEALRVWEPGVWDFIRRNPALFAGFVSDTLGKDQLAASLDTCLAGASSQNREAVRSAISEVFPKASWAWGGMSYGADWEARWRRACRACSPDVFPVYFRLAVPSATASAAEIGTILALAWNPEAMRQKLLELVHQVDPDQTRIRALLDRLHDYTDEEIPEAAVGSMVKALLDVGDQLLPLDDQVGFFELRTEILIDRLLYSLLGRLPPSQRMPLLQDALGCTASVAVPVGLATILGQEHGKYGGHSETNPLLTRVEQETLEQLALERIRSAAAAHRLLDTPDLVATLYRWKGWGDEGETQTWISTVTESDQGLLSFLRRFRYTSQVVNLGDAVARTHEKFHIAALGELTDPHVIAKRLESLSKSPTTTAEDQALIALVRSSQSTEGV